jgi:hypothetical protein
MLDPNYDPYQQLEIAKHNITELIKGFNDQSEIFKEFVEQHNAMVMVVKDLQRRVRLLESENLLLKSQIATDKTDIK